MVTETLSRGGPMHFDSSWNPDSDRGFESLSMGADIPLFGSLERLERLRASSTPRSGPIRCRRWLLTIVAESDPVSYVRACAKNAPWDVVVVDGINRKKCCLEAASHLTDGGVVIFDDTERPRYWHVVLEMREKGFRDLSIMGLGALSNEAKQTTILYRPDNCLGI